MANTYLGNLSFPIIYCTYAEYSAIAIKDANRLYIITDAQPGSNTIYFNNKGLSSITNLNGAVVTVNDILPDNVGNVELSANDLDTYNKREIDDAIGNVLNIQYLKAPISALTVDSGRELYTQNTYPITDKNMVIEENDDIIKFIVTSVINSTTNGIYIRTMNKQTHEYTDEDTGNTYSTAVNQVGYTLLFANETFCYFSKTGSTSNGLIPLQFYSLNYKIPSSTITNISSFPKSFLSTVKFVKIGAIVYGFGGGGNWNGTDNWKSIWKYNITTNVWTTLSAELPFVSANAETYSDEINNCIYLSMGFQSNVASGWSQKYAYRFNIDTETITRIQNRSVNAFKGLLAGCNIGPVAIPNWYRNSSNWTWGELGSQVYIPEIDEWISFSTGFPILSGSGTSGTGAAPGGSIIDLVDIVDNTLHLLVDGVSYYLSFNLSILGLFSAGESLFIKGKLKSNQDVEINGNLVPANTIILANTEIKIIYNDTRITLLSDITEDGSWIQRPPRVLTGVAEEVTLWEGNIGSSDSNIVNTWIDLTDSILNYDKVGISIGAVSNVSGSIHRQYREFLRDDVLVTFEDSVDKPISTSWGYGNNVDDTSILTDSEPTRLHISQASSYLFKIIGINYKI